MDEKQEELQLQKYNEQIDKIMNIFPEYFFDENTSESKKKLYDIAKDQLKILAKIIYTDGVFDGKYSCSK